MPNDQMKKPQGKMQEGLHNLRLFWYNRTVQMQAKKFIYPEKSIF